MALKKNSKTTVFKRQQPSSRGTNNNPDNPARGEDEESILLNAKRFAEINRRNELDAQLGFPPMETGTRMGWMLNMQSTWIVDPEWPRGRSAVDYYFMAEDGSCFKATLKYSPYFFVKCQSGSENEVENYLRRRFENTIESIIKVSKEDLDMPNHLSGAKRHYLKLSFRNTADLLTVRKVLLPIALKNGEHYKELLPSINQLGPNPLDDRDINLRGKKRVEGDALAKIVGLREYDIAYHLRVAIDLNIRVGLWYTINVAGPSTTIHRVPNRDVRPDLVVLAFDIETSKMPLKFPDPQQDHIMMISYMINGRGYLIVNRDIVSQDIESFEYTPKPDFPGHFTVYNEANEAALLNRFFAHIQLVRPQVFVTYNGDFFDWPFVEKRAIIHGLDMFELIGIKRNPQDEYGGTHCSHMDCFAWVKRDSYLPAGSHGLKAVCAVKLGYDPLELDPELMTPLASQDPHTLANYSVSDAVATYYLYQKYVHPFIFSLGTIIPLAPDEVLRKGTGTLCETLLMAQAYHANVIMPNKHEEARERFHRGHLLESETYIGGHVEALEAGVYRSDFTYRFKIDAPTVNRLVEDLDRALRFFLEHEAKVPYEEIANYEAIYGKVKTMLDELAQMAPIIHDRPLIYHLDVGSMYPNIILTNRLQPSAIVDEAACAICDYNRPGKQCQRRMTWSWRGEFFSAKQNEYKMIRRQLEGERFPSKQAPNTTISFHELSAVEQTALLKKRLATYSQKVYKKTRQNETIQRDSIVCQRENSFYIDTVKSFRDRRYDYKNLQKVWKKKLEEAQAANEPTRVEEASKMLVLYDSLQLAHKCILNSFYGYVMRKAARWYSMEMGGIVCETGAAIITLARELIEKFGRPLELDTDGIWCMLPSGFPQNFAFETRSGKKVYFAYPCVMLNHLLFDRFTNHQYQTRQPDSSYVISSENSIFFEIDGPYRAMVLPSSIEEDKQLKKRYAVFNEDGTLAELKGFEIKRRGELQLIKIFQSQIFKTFLKGATLTDCYQEVAAVANYWLNILYTRGQSMEDAELLELISENRSMSRSLEEYGAQKSTSLSTARRLAEFLGDAMVKDRGLACKFIISARPLGLPVTSRAIPVAIFSATPEIRRHFLGKWLRDPVLAQGDIRDIIDWEYYVERIGFMIQKLIVIPAALQNVPNPVPRVVPPEWLKRRGVTKDGLACGISSTRWEQTRITDKFFIRADSNNDGGMVSHHTTKVTTTIAIEDLPRSKKASRNAISTKRPLAEPTRLDISSLEAALPHIDYATDYVAWLRSRKPYWLLLPQTWTNRGASSQTKKDDTYSSSYDKSRINLRSTPWQIIQIIPLPQEPGQYQAWILVEQRVLRLVRLAILRQFYIATREATPNLGEPVNFRLPEGNEVAPFLYEIVMPEPIYQTEFRPQWATLVDSNIIRGWEMEIPLDFYLAVKLGATVSVKPEFRQPKIGWNQASPDFALHELQFRSTTEVGYLQGEALSYGVVGAIAASDGRAILMLGWSNVISEQVPQIRLMVVDEGMHRQLGQPALKAVSSQLSKINNNGTRPFPYERVEFEVDYYRDLDSARRSLHRAINTRIDARAPPTILLSLTGDADTWLGLKDGSLLNPIGLTMPILALPTWLGTFILPPLDWQRSGARRLLEYYYGLNEWLSYRLAMARYAHIPLGSLLSCRVDRLNGGINSGHSSGNSIKGGAELEYVSDIFFARALRAHGFLLPWNYHTPHSTLPFMNKTSSVGMMNFVGKSPLMTPGLYRQVTVDMDVSGLALNSLLEHSFLLSDTSGDPTIIVGSTSHAVRSTSPILPLIRGILTGWIKEMMHNRNELASHLIEGAFRWIRTRGASKLLSPFFYRDTTRDLMARARDRLHDYWRSLGGIIVHGDDHRLVLATAKDHPDNARAFLEYGLSMLKRTDGLAWLTLTIRTCWRSLLWYDHSNYVGYQYIDSNCDENIKVDQDTSIQLNQEACGQSNQETSSQSNQEPRGQSNRKATIQSTNLIENPVTNVYEAIDINQNTSEQGAMNRTALRLRLNLVNYLPSILQKPFTVLVMEYLKHVQDLTLPIDAERPPDLIETLNPDTYPSFLAEEEPEQAIDDDDGNVEIIPLDYKNKVLSVVRQLQRMYMGVTLNALEEERWAIPNPWKLPNHEVNLRGGPPTLLVRSLGAFWLLDRVTGPEAFKLLRNAYHLLGVGEFSEEAHFKDPIPDSLVLPHIVCASCGGARDVHLTRDWDMVQALHIKGAASSSLKCAICNHHYDMIEWEHELIEEMVKPWLILYQGQDLMCVKCKSLKMNYLGRRCNDCGGGGGKEIWQGTIERTELVNQLLVLKRLAEQLKWSSLFFLIHQLGI